MVSSPYIAELGAGVKMNLRKVQIELDVLDVQRIMAIALDEDKDKALEYVKGSLVKQIEKILQPH